MEKIVNGKVVTMSTEEEADRIADWNKNKLDLEREQQERQTHLINKENAIIKIKTICQLTDKEVEDLFY
jgi:hypothetical protein